jgi:3-hydroxyisobutyrate dehydrogenase
MIGMTNLAVLAEGYLLCKRAGVADDIFATALADTGAWSYQADVRLPWMMHGDYEPRFPVTLGLKDVRLAVDMAGQWGLGVPVAAAGMSQLAAAQAHGWGQLDVVAVLKVLDPQSEVIPRAE